MAQLRRHRLGSAAVALLVLLVPLDLAGLERLREPAGAVDRPPGPVPTTPAPPATATTIPTATTATGRAARPAPLGTPEQAIRALSRLPPGWTNLPKPPGPRNDGTSLWIGNGLFFWGGKS